MKKALPIIFIFFTLKTIAQPTFTAVDLNFVVGEIFSNRQDVDTSGIFQGGSGPNQVWNFVLSPIGVPLLTEILSPANVSYSSVFPNANIVLKDSSANDASYSFIHQNQDSLAILGVIFVSSPNFIDTIIFNNPLLYYQYPITYLATYNDVFQINSGANASIDKISGVYDAYGDITLNGILFSNVIRKHELDTSIYPGISPDTIYYERFQWIAIGEKLPLLNISYSRFGNIGAYEKDVTVSGNIFAKIKQAQGESALSIYPNPAQNELKISNAIKGSTFYEIKDLSGKTIISDQLNPISKTIDIKALSEGLYILELKSKDKVLTKKFVKHL
jgi:Secretion system C-terminal sorting domain